MISVNRLQGCIILITLLVILTGCVNTGRAAYAPIEEPIIPHQEPTLDEGQTKTVLADSEVVYDGETELIIEPDTPISTMNTLITDFYAGVSKLPSAFCSWNCYCNNFAHFATSCTVGDETTESKCSDYENVGVTTLTSTDPTVCEDISKQSDECEADSATKDACAKKEAEFESRITQCLEDQAKACNDKGGRYQAKLGPSGANINARVYRQGISN